MLSVGTYTGSRDDYAIKVCAPAILGAGRSGSLAAWIAISIFGPSAASSSFVMAIRVLARHAAGLNEWGGIQLVSAKAKVADALGVMV